MKVKLGALAVLLCVATVQAADWPQFRGPMRDGKSAETGLLKQWPEGGPKLLWTYAEAGVGFSGPAVVGDRLYMCGGRGDSEFVFALDLKSSPPKEIWATKIGPTFTWKGNVWNMGPNVTPTVDGELLYALGGGGELVCVETATGTEKWRKHMARDLGGEVNPIGGGAEEPTPLGWGYAWAPLVDGEQLVCVPGGKQGLFAALDKKTGTVLWRSKEVTDQVSYSSPIMVDAGGVKQYVQAVNSGVVGVAAKDGKKLWAYTREPAYDDVVISTPIFHDNHVFSSVGFAQGCDLVKLVGQAGDLKAEKVYSNKTVQNRDGGLVLVDGHLFGHSENQGWCCVEFKSGKVVWSERDKLTRGTMTFADGHLYCASEKGGSIVLVEASTKGWTEKGRLKLPQESKRRLPSGGMWTHPVIANGRLYIRDQEFLYCFDLKP